MKEGKNIKRKEGKNVRGPQGLSPSRGPTFLRACLISLPLCVLALRVTYTEAPTAQTSAAAGGLSDTVYSLTLSGLLIFGFIAWVVRRFVSGRCGYRFTGLEIGLALFIVAAILSSFGASDRRAAINHATILLASVFAALLLTQILDSPGKVRLVLIVIVALGIVSAYQCAEQFFVSNAITIEQYEKDPNLFLGPLGIEPGTFQHFLFEHRIYSRGIRGFFTTSNSAASFAICASFAAIALFAGRLGRLRDRKNGVRYAGLAAIALVLTVGGLFLTRSKGGILAFLVGLGVFGLLMAIDRWLPGYKRAARTVVVLSVVLCVVAVGFVAVQYGIQHGRLPGGNSMLVRWQYWAASAQMYADHPLTGVGPGNFSDYYTHYKPAAALESVADPHNWPLSLITQYGPLGLLAFVVLFAIPLGRSLLSSSIDTAVTSRPISRTFILSALFVLVLCLLLVRPLLIPIPGPSDLGVLLYEVITLFVTPAAAFLIGFLLVAAPFEQNGASPDLPRPILCASLVAAILAVLLHNLIDFALFEPGVWMTFWILIACLAASRSRPEPTPEAAVIRPKRLRLSAVGAALAFLGAYAYWIWLPAYGVSASIAKSQKAIASGRFDLAHNALEKASAMDRLSPAAANFNGRLYLQQYDQIPRKSTTLLEEAALCFREAISRSPADYKNYEKLAVVYARLDEFQKAYDWYLQATERYPGCERLWFELGQLADRLDKPDAALAHYERAVAIEDAYREQFRRMYPDRKQVVSRLGAEEYRIAQERIAALKK